MALLPEDKEDEALRMFRAARPIEDIYHFLWPQGRASVSYGNLTTVLRAISESEEQSEASDELPDDVGAAISDLETARARLMEAIESGNAEGGANPGLHAALASNVKAHLAASKHRIELQKHRQALADASRATGRGRRQTS